MKENKKRKGLISLYSSRSTEEQYERRVQICREYCETHNIEVIGIFRHGHEEPLQSDKKELIENLEKLDERSGPMRVFTSEPIDDPRLECDPDTEYFCVLVSINNQSLTRKNTDIEI